MADMRIYLLSLGAGLLVGIVYSLLNVSRRSSATRPK
jgi:xanthosine utilization system XapX-like protein